VMETVLSQEQVEESRLCMYCVRFQPSLDHPLCVPCMKQFGVKPNWMFNRDWRLTLDR